ncbi:uncharacterized protein LOC121832865 isoform X2 [Ixodes scapularis]|uniref:uncharacterized protein LOC121832865 isoform X2 n=1 Tax=Ixodes scapularis TaxID=6945 RepID=UPI001A9D3D41|nr:uncharacterized protein LOC121832865 isoform X2 [Ixodes scapularis]
MVQELVVNANLPFSLVKQRSFRHLMQCGFPSRHVMCRPKLMSEISKDAAETMEVIRKKLGDLQYVSSTADCWSLHKRLEGVCTEYDILDKPTFTTTDSGSNFIKAFSHFGRQYEDYTDTSSASEIEDDICTAVPIYYVLEARDQSDGVYSLPHHQRCVCHMPNLIATKDVENAEESSPKLKKQIRQTFSKCSALWKKQARSTVVPDAISSSCEGYLPTPVLTRWNSTCDCLKSLHGMLVHIEEKFKEVCENFKIPRFTKSDIHFIEEHVQVLTPLAQAITLLQRENSMFMAYLRPTVASLRKTMSALLTENLRYCSPVVESLIVAINKRFAGMEEEKHLIISAICHPKFKAAWIDNEVERKRAWDYLKNKLMRTSTIEKVSSGEQTDEDEEDCEHFFTFETSSSSASWEQEFVQYTELAATRSLDCLKHLPLLKSVFLKFNTGLPSSAAAERVYSIRGTIAIKLRSKMSDEHFGEVLILRSNRALK